VSRVVVTEFISLDGVMEDPGGAEGFKHGGWTFKFERGPEGGKFKMDELVASDALLLGRVTYQGFAQAWPSMSDGFADKMNGIRKYVVSRTMNESDATWNNTTIVRGDVATEVAKLKAQPGGDLLVEGSAQLAQALIAHDLVDELRLMVFPIIRGTGKRFFPDQSEPATLQLVDAKPDGGVMLLTYKRPVTSPDSMLK
jgi:dihydrofolate reductase